MADDTVEFVLLFVGVSTVFASVGGFVVYNETVTYIDFEGTVAQEEVPTDVDVVPYSDLSFGQRVFFERLVNDNPKTVREPPFVPPEYVRKSGVIHHFTGYDSFEWTASGTFVPMIVGLVGVGSIIVAARRSLRS